ncbi:MAG: cyclophilin-like fold protein [Nitrososphaerales archaeon]
MPAGSVSRTKLLLELKGKGDCECELARHLAPLTVGSLLRAIPVEGRAHRFEDKFVYFETGLTIGMEKQRRYFKRGDLAFMITNGSICVFVRDSSASSGLNPIGNVTSNLELIENSSLGDVLLLRQA